MIKETHKTNKSIIREFNEVIVIDNDGNNLGLMSSIDAYNCAQDAGLDLVLVGSGGSAPTCRIADYNKMLYIANKKKPVKKQATSCVQFSLKIDIGDYQNKLNQVMRLIDEGCKVVMNLRCKGREIGYIESAGLAVIKKALVDLEGKVRVESQPKVEGRFVSATVAPIAKS